MDTLENTVAAELFSIKQLFAVQTPSLNNKRRYAILPFRFIKRWGGNYPQPFQ